MQIILLSGGSGKRLWPLSNNVRSKQFLRLLPNNEGVNESMVQRVLRQIKEAKLTDSVVIATGVSQKEIITNQLGSNVEIVTEPCRRDTFPAIALAASYLAKEKQCSVDEVVVVMPCDPYIEAEYFKTISSMVAEVEKNTADMVLMGITPTYPSTKFGYVEPLQEKHAELIQGDIYKVARFIEKPSFEIAEELIKQNAFWNGGVFAFKLGYITAIVDKYIQADTFAEVNNRYEEFPKISFDYEVAEKAESVAVVPYKGLWKDLGTWNALVEEISNVSIGNVVVGNHVVNSKVFNELNIPVVCEGVKDLIVAASPDGILVCGVDQSENIKCFVEQIQSRPMFEERRWGEYRVLDHTKAANGFESLTKNICLKPGCSISYQRHTFRDEVWTVVEGEGLLVLEGVTRKITAGDTVAIMKAQLHALKALTHLSFIEVQTGFNLEEEDIERFEWKW